MPLALTCDDNKHHFDFEQSSSVSWSILAQPDTVPFLY